MIEFKWNNNAYSQITKKLRSPMAPIFHPWWKKIAEEAKTVAEEESPVGKRDGRGPGGQLKASHRVNEVNQYRIDVINVAPYAKFVHWGFHAHWIPSGILPWPVMRLIATRDQPPNPWISRAVKIMDSRMQGHLNEFVRTNLADWWKGA